MSENIFDYPNILILTDFLGGCKWIRIPAIVYSSHVATTVWPIIAHVLFSDYSKSSIPAPVTQSEKLTLCAIYAPYFIIPIMILLTMLFHPDYCDKEKLKSQ